MLPLHARVVAIDDDESHLKMISWGLGKAGFCAVPYFFDDGMLADCPPEPLSGVRLVFSDVHMTTGALNRAELHASNIITCLKKLIAPGPYALIFWTQFPDDALRIQELIQARAAESDLTPPVGYGRIDKNEVLQQENGDPFDAEKLRAMIVEQAKGFSTLAATASWEDRVFKAAASTTNLLFGLAAQSAEPTRDWEHLLAYLASESVGWRQARNNLESALDNALLPILEDRLSMIAQDSPGDSANFGGVGRFLDQERAPRHPNSIEITRLNTNYLVEEVRPGLAFSSSDRGMVTELGGSFINSGDFVRSFGMEAGDLIAAEFCCTKFSGDEGRQAKLHIVELGPECDHVQGKVVTHRYLLALLVPAALLGKCKTTSRSNRTLFSYANASILDTGSLRFSDRGGDFHLLISCRSFMSLAPTVAVNGTCRFRLRRALIEEVMHTYTAHARRPGVMRFQA